MTAWAEIEEGSDPRTIIIGAARAEYELCRAIPGARFDGEDGLWRVNLTWPTYACLREAWIRQPITILPELEAWAAERWTEIQLRYLMRNALDADGELLAKLLSMEHVGGPQLTPPQRGAVAWLTRWRREIFGDPRGNGKTPPLCRSMSLLHETGELAPALVISPSGLISWKRKLAAWSPELRTVIIKGSAKARHDALVAIAAGEYDVGIIDYANVRFHTRLAMFPGQAYVRCASEEHPPSERGKDPKITAGRCEIHEKEMNKIITWGGGDGAGPHYGFRTVIPDEAHWLADPTTKQTRAVWWLMHHAENSWPTTGTLTVNSVADLWAVRHGLDPLAFPNRAKYLDMFATQGPAFAGHGKVVIDLKPEAELPGSTFRLITEPYFRRIPKAVARPGEGGMAEPEYRFPEMTPKQAKIYSAIATTGLAELADRDYVVEESITAFTRMCQLATSMILVEDGTDPMGFTKRDAKVTRVLPSHKINDLLEFLAAEDGQWIIAVNAPEVAFLAEEKLAENGWASSHILGGMTPEARDAAEQAFQRGDARCIFINQAGREVIDLQAADGIYWLQLNPSFVHREQITGRGDRFGHQAPLREVVVITPGTVDNRLWELCQSKEAKHERITQDASMLRWAMTVEPGEVYGEKAMA